MLRKIIWTIVILAAIAGAYFAYEYNTQLIDAINNININDNTSLIDKAKDLSEQLSGALSTSGSSNILSGTEAIVSGVVNTLSGTVAEITSGANEVLSGTIN